MDIYKKAARMKLRFDTERGTLSVEQLWDLKLSDLAKAIKQSKKLISESSNDDELSFLNETTNVSPENQLTFDVLKDVYITKKEELDKAKDAAEIKAHNERIMEKIQAKQEEELGDKSVDELKALLK